ncbi:AfsR/SARP family transcriptional regulator [Actinomadura roseirufa]|uniref:AfsR/SARP family transcriptional regulator n=1 Tax=Actinomadura roseirufa TaxID=2094049 RepID=UPI0013F14F08|nr:BTAD domain-containing putative transcriptional regulator [Actinomadura roseirufa]
MSVDAIGEQVIVHLLPEFSCSLTGVQGGLSGTGRRLVTRLAFESGALSRKMIEAEFWPDMEPGKAGRRLSQLLWRIRSATEDALVRVDGDRVGLAGDVAVDYWAAKTLARNVLKSDERFLHDVDPVILKLLSTELLRDVLDEQVLRERDHWDRLRLLALERVAAACLEAGDPLAALETGLLATGVDDLAERASRIVFSAYVAVGDTVAARRVYLGYEDRVRRSLGVDASPAFHDLVREQLGRNALPG